MAGDSFMQIVGGLAEDEGKQNPDAVGEKHAERAHGVTPAVALQVGQQRAQTLRQHAKSVDEILAAKVHDIGRRWDRAGSESGSEVKKARGSQKILVKRFSNRLSGALNGDYPCKASVPPSPLNQWNDRLGGKTLKNLWGTIT